MAQTRLIRVEWPSTLLYVIVYWAGKGDKLVAISIAAWSLHGKNKGDILSLYSTSPTYWRIETGWIVSCEFRAKNVGNVGDNEDNFPNIIVNGSRFYRTRHVFDLDRYACIHVMRSSNAACFTWFCTDPWIKLPIAVRLGRSKKRSWIPCSHKASPL